MKFSIFKQSNIFLLFVLSLLVILLQQSEAQIMPTNEFEISSTSDISTSSSSLFPDTEPSKAILLYDTWQKTFTNSTSYQNRFDYSEITLNGLFISPSGKEYMALGFYDGQGGVNKDHVWRIRFMPMESGVWRYSIRWSDHGQELVAGSIQVLEYSAKGNYGHVYLDPQNQKYLIHENGDPHYWFGGKWMAAQDYGPEYKDGKLNANYKPKGSNFGYKSNQQLLSYLESMAKYRHNGLLLKIAMFPLNNDLLSWDIKWIRRGEWFVREAQKRGIYVQVNFFDTWARDRNEWFKDHTQGDSHPFNVWQDGNEKEKQNYIKTIIARFASFSNVYWELGNEMEHPPNNGALFAEQANSKYIPWIHSFDPYHLPIGLSEGIWQKTDVDIGFLHQTFELPQPTWQQPSIMNELVRSGSTSPPLGALKKVLKKILAKSGLSGDFVNKLKNKFFGKQRASLWRHDAISDPQNRLAYRRTFWRMFTYGGCGSSEATWLEIDKELSTTVQNVMQDHMNLRNFLESLPENINRMNPDPSFVLFGPGTYSTRSSHRRVYVSYFLLHDKELANKGNAKVVLPEGKYNVAWYDPQITHPLISYALTITEESQETNLIHPTFDDDIVLLITADTGEAYATD